MALMMLSIFTVRSMVRMFIQISDVGKLRKVDLRFANK